MLEDKVQHSTIDNYRLLEKPTSKKGVKALVQRQLMSWLRDFSIETELTFSRFNSDIIYQDNNKKIEHLCVVIHIDLDGLENEKR